jgi:serine/threonine protein kinase
MAKAPDIFESAFNTYSVTGEIAGEGGSGRVFVVNDDDGNEFALKCLLPERVSSEKRKRFKNEIEFCRNHRHNNIVTVVDAGLVVWNKHKCPFYVMPRFPMTLRALMSKGIVADEVLPLFSKILDGVEAAHLLSVIHRDIKPENILYDPGTKTLVVADFGIAHFEEEMIATAVKTGAFEKMANLRYSAPEQRTKGATVDLRVDIFALGLILNEMFTHSVPQGDGYATIAPIAPSFAYLDTIVKKMIQQTPEARFGTLAEIKNELIGRRIEFVAFQELDKKRGEVVLAGTPPAFQPVELVAIADWKAGNLILELNQDPSPGWIQRFIDPRGNWSSIMGAGPENFKFRYNTASVQIREQDVQQVVNNFKDYLKMANVSFEQGLKSEVKQMEMKKRQQLEREIADVEARERIFKNVKI